MSGGRSMLVVLGRLLHLSVLGRRASAGSVATRSGLGPARPAWKLSSTCRCSGCDCSDSTRRLAALVSGGRSMPLLGRWLLSDWLWGAHVQRVTVLERHCRLGACVLSLRDRRQGRWRFQREMARRGVSLESAERLFRSLAMRNRYVMNDGSEAGYWATRRKQGR